MKNSLQRGFLPVIGIVIVLLVVGGGYYAIKGSTERKDVYTEVATTTESTSATVPTTNNVVTSSVNITLRDDGYNGGKGILSGTTKVSSGDVVSITWDFGTREQDVRASGNKFAVVLADEMICPPCAAGGAVECKCVGSNVSYVVATNLSGSSAKFKAGSDINGKAIPAGSYIVRIAISGKEGEYYLSSSNRIQIVAGNKVSVPGEKNKNFPECPPGVVPEGGMC